MGAIVIINLLLIIATSSSYLITFKGIDSLARHRSSGQLSCTGDKELDMKEITVTVEGQVQGPFYRTTVRNEVLFNRKLAGRLVEAKSGSSDIIVQGSQAKLESFVRWCKKGPGLSQEVHVKDTQWRELNSAKLNKTSTQNASEFQEEEHIDDDVQEEAKAIY
eukprot:gene8052-16510_t